MTTIDEFKNYPTPTKGIREKYKAVFNKEDGPGWTKGTVEVFRTEEGGSQTKVAEYKRNYAMLDTFEPFQQLQGDRWHEYALISQRYTRLSVLDLETGEVVADEPYPVFTQDMADRIPHSKYKVGDEMPGSGFCPAAFYVPDWWEQWNEEYLPESLLSEDFSSDGFVQESIDRLSLTEGKWGVYSGCVWGDDSSWKLRYVDLSRISEGIVKTDNRFGYVELPYGVSLKDSINLETWYEGGMIQVSVPVNFSLGTGEALGKDLVLDGINWAD